MENDLRIFFAIDLPADIKERMSTTLKNLSQQFNSKIRWAQPSSFHITLQFLKKFHEEDLLPLIKNTEEKLHTTQSFPLILEKTELFPSKYKPHVVSIFIPKTENLQQIASILGQTLVDLSYAIEQRPFRPHLTLGRINRNNHIKLTPEDISLNFEVKEIILYRSRPEIGASHYIPLHIFNLK